MADDEGFVRLANFIGGRPLLIAGLVSPSGTAERGHGIVSASLPSPSFACRRVCSPVDRRVHGQPEPCHRCERKRAGNRLLTNGRPAPPPALCETNRVALHILLTMAGKVYGATPLSNADDVEAAVAAAKEGFAVWSAMAASERADIMRRIANAIEERIDEFAEAEVSQAYGTSCEV